jgi:hypothetical protein
MRVLNQTEFLIFSYTFLIISFVVICCLPPISTFIANRFGVAGNRLFLLCAGFTPLIICSLAHFLHCYGLLQSKPFLAIAIFAQLDFFVYIFMLLFVVYV